MWFLHRAFEDAEMSQGNDLVVAELAGPLRHAASVLI